MIDIQKLPLELQEYIFTEYRNALRVRRTNYVLTRSIPTRSAPSLKGEDDLERIVRQVYMAGGLTGVRLEQRVRERLALE
jgi:hypothetical protein